MLSQSDFFFKLPRRCQFVYPLFPFSLHLPTCAFFFLASVVCYSAHFFCVYFSHLYSLCAWAWLCCSRADVLLYTSERCIGALPSSILHFVWRRSLTLFSSCALHGPCYSCTDVLLHPSEHCDPSPDGSSAFFMPPFHLSPIDVELLLSRKRAFPHVARLETTSDRPCFSAGPLLTPR